MAFKKDNNNSAIVRAISELWQPLTDEEIKILSDDIYVQKFKRNQLIYKDFDGPTRMMCLVQGKVKIFKVGIGGRNQILRIIKPIEFFGFRAYFADEDYKTAAMAFEPSIVAFFSMPVMMKLMKSNFNISLFFIKYLSKQLGYSDDRTVNLTQKHIRGRLAESLIFLRDSYGIEEDGYTLSIYLSREDLANLSNMTTSNAIRTLSAFANEKLIAIDGRKIKLINSDEILRISQLG
ncbi:Crp/Fnr family transcriptional regulator [Prevotella herbatica]|uniref:Crp/Fnr family transcriptional regulator n=1 Tax=Prevotella herbatica TaxID=2801997 RepID=A0ABM7NZX5_9BACT|nr:Crp/Fnr family transcriptional regulator [Prevotella herbatica]BCS86085.1 Crp/Fnr family transcriptional regulator [Prevotella herbatica]